MVERTMVGKLIEPLIQLRIKRRNDVLLPLRAKLKHKL